MTDAPVQPRTAATLILVRETTAQPLQTLMVVRHEAITFAGGAIVFPGGRIDGTDIALATALGDDALKIAAIRETFEESGILLAYETSTRGTISKEASARIVARYRSAVCDGDITFGDMLRTENLNPATDRLIPFARWITPPARAKRFDTHFFIATCDDDHDAAHDGGETTEAIWISPADLVQAAKEERYKLVFATRMNLQRLAMSETVSDALAQARATPVVTVRPEAIDTPTGRMIRIPADAGYGGELFLTNDPPSI